MNIYTNEAGKYNFFDNEGSFTISYNKGLRYVSMNPRDNANSYDHELEFETPLSF